MPGSIPPTSQLDWLISTTAMIVLLWSRATRDLLKSFGWGIAALHRLMQRRSCHVPASRPIASIGPAKAAIAALGATAGTGLLAATTGGVFLGGALLAALSGIVTDPLQRRLGLHRRRLLRLLRALEGILSGETGQSLTIYDHYVARLADIVDILALGPETPLHNSRSSSRSLP